MTILREYFFSGATVEVRTEAACPVNNPWPPFSGGTIFMLMYVLGQKLFFTKLTFAQRIMRCGAVPGGRNNVQQVLADEGRH